MPRRRKRTTNRVPQDQRRLRVRGQRREVPDAKRLSRAFIGIALARADAEARAQAERAAATTDRGAPSDSESPDGESGGTAEEADSAGGDDDQGSRGERSRPTHSDSSCPKSNWVFSQLHLPRPLTATQVDVMLLRLAADRAAPPIVFEARAEAGHLVQHLVGTPPAHVVWVQRTLRDLLPGLELVGLQDRPEQRPGVERSVRLRIRPRAVALAVDRAEVTSLSLLSALDARLARGERVVVQVVLSRRVPPVHLPRELSDPTQPLWRLLLHGEARASKSLRGQVDARSGQHGFVTTIRVGASAATPQRRQQLIVGVLGALSTAADRGTYLDLTFEPATRLNQPQLPSAWSPRQLRLGATELTGLLGWPLGERDLPGVAPRHPRPLGVPHAVSRTDRLFAVTGAPGAQEWIGIAAADIGAHLVVVGPTGVGKSTVLLHLVAADCAAGRAVLVIDPKRQLVDDILNRAVPQERIDDVVVLDPADLSSGRMVGINPLDVGERDPDVVVDGLIAVLRGVFHDGWGPRTEDILHASLLTLARVGAVRDEPYTLLDLPRLLTEERFRASVVGQVTNDPGLGSFWSWYLSQTPAAQAQAIAAPLNKLRQYLLRPSLRAILGQPRPAFRLRDVFRANKVVLVPLNEALVGPITAQLLGSLIVAETWSATLERAREDNPIATPASVYVDEVQQYLHLPVSIDDALSRSRSYGVGWHLAHQHRGQLPASTRAAIDSNAKSKIVFQPLDPDDARAMARRAPELDAVDFLSLGRYQAYANLVAEGRPAGWALIRTLAPPATTGLATRVRQRSRDQYARPIPVTQQFPALPTNGSSSGEPQVDEPEAGGDAPVGRKRRQP